jgi:manganese transport protein
VNATQALVVSQVVLSIAQPLPMIAVVLFTRRADIMGRFANARLTTACALLAMTLVLALNVVLIAETFGLLQIGS